MKNQIHTLTVIHIFKSENKTLSLIVAVVFLPHPCCHNTHLADRCMFSISGFSQHVSDQSLRMFNHCQYSQAPYHPQRNMLRLLSGIYFSHQL